jgi:cytochrome c oxidase subunit 2
MSRLMRFRSASAGQWLRWISFLVLVVLATAGCAENYPQTTLAPKGDFARLVDDVFMITVRWAILVFVVVEGFLIYAIIKFRGKPDDPEPKQFHGSTVLEILWTAIPAVILVLIAVPTIRTIFLTAETPGDGALVVEVVGHQWWWEFHYPQYGITTANELHVPVGRTVDVRMTSDDVIHSLWLPQLAAKRDVFPGRETRIWFTAEVGGLYSGQCAEFCGIQHGRMGLQVVASDSADFAGWAAAMSSATEPVVITDSASQAAAGQQLFLTKACVGCHSFNASAPPAGLIGPNLANIGARTHIAAGMLENSDANLERWIHDPQGFKEGSKMMNLGLTESETQALVAYLRAQQVVNADGALAARID